MNESSIVRVRAIKEGVMPCSTSVICRKAAVSLTTLALFAFLLLPTCRPADATAQGPMDLIKRTVEEARTVFNDNSLGPEQKIEKLREIAEQRFDFAEMSKRVLAGQWRKLSPKRRKEFVSLFSKLVEDVYSSKVRRYQKEIKEQAHDKVFYVDERIDEPYATVRTNIMTTAGAQVSVDYRLIRKGGEWLVYDVVVEGVSLINNYRTQFREIIGRGSYEDLLRRLKEKVGQ
ncbi:MAG: ABC transporter substrate-binding protein [Candidatus Sulfobium sp.]|jgi:phospholipid transport system substrate-binding protein